MIKNSEINTVDISLIVPMYNEEEVLSLFFTEIYALFKSIPQYAFEIICINDGSKDKTLPLLKEYAQKDSRIKIISFSRNFFKEQALYAGLKYSSGKAVIPMDADLQHPPFIIPEFIREWEKGFDVVLGIRKKREEEGKIKKTTAKLFYSMYNKISENPIPANAGDFRLMSRKVVDAILQVRDKKLFMKGIFNWVGFKTTSIYYECQQRAAGTTKWNYWKLWNFALDGITSSTTLPLRIWTYLGGIISASAFFLAILIILKTLVWGDPVQGFPTLAVLILFFGGIQLLALGIFGEYIGRIMYEVKDRPLYIIDELINFTE